VGIHRGSRKRKVVGTIQVLIGGSNLVGECGFIGVKSWTITVDCNDSIVSVIDCEKGVSVGIQGNILDSGIDSISWSEG
jgi:hypothetical protein